MKSKIKQKIFSISAIILLTGCKSITDPIVRTHGFVPSPTELSQIKSQRMSQSSVAKFIGDPFIVGSYNPNYWYYISYHTSQYGFGAKKYTKFNIVEMHFVNGIVNKINLFDKNNLQQITFNNDITDTSGKKLGAGEQFIGNIGKFRTKPND